MPHPLEGIDELVAAQQRDMLNLLLSFQGEGVEGLSLLITDFGVRVKITEHGWVLLVRTIYNWRIVDARNDPFKGHPTTLSGYSRGWCYAEPGSFLRAALMAVYWSGMPDTEPVGWIKSLPDERRHGEPRPDITQEG